MSHKYDFFFIVTVLSVSSPFKLRMIRSGLLFIFNVFCYIIAIDCHGPCNVVFRYGKTIEYNCMGLTFLNEYLEKAPANATDINVVDSEIPSITRYSFVRFGSTLETLNLHKCGIAVIDLYGFAGLVVLKKLVLWENKLTWISAESFQSLTNLRHLDVSFNEIFGIDNAFYQLLPNLENFYFDYNQLVTLDYNMFPLLSNLKRVKFGYNPWNWRYRILLTWQLDALRVDYRDDWEEWGWMNDAARECQDSGQEKTLNDTILDCAIRKFLRLEIALGHSITDSNSTNTRSDVSCFYEAISLVRCPTQLATNRESIRRAFESLMTTLKVMDESSEKLNYYSLV